MIDCLKRGIPKPASLAATTMEPPSGLRGLAAGKHARCIDLDEVCILDSAMSRKKLTSFQTGDFAEVLRVFSKQCKFKTVRRILLPLNTSWEGITFGTSSHWILAKLHLETDHTHLYDWFKKRHDQYEIVAGLAPCKTPIMCTAAHVCLCPTVAHSRCVLPAAPCRPSWLLSCTSNVWASASTLQLTSTPSACRSPFTIPPISRTVLTAVCVVKQDPMRWWKSASTNICSTVLARIWEPQSDSTAKGGWLEDSTVDAVILWSLYGDTNVGGLAPSPTRTGYIQCMTF
jgi:hypothetical protein